MLIMYSSVALIAINGFKKKSKKVSLKEPNMPCWNSVT